MLKLNEMSNNIYICNICKCYKKYEITLLNKRNERNAGLKKEF